MVFKLKKQYRLPGYDYSRPGFYFVTICVRGREELFGKVINNKMILSEIGEITKLHWLQLAKSFSNIYLDEWIIMPNHLHAVVEIVECRTAPWRGLANGSQNDGVVSPNGENAPRRVPTTTTPTIHPLQKNSLSSIINHFKGNVKRHCNKIGVFFYWQPKFHDRIIRSELVLFRIREYIKTNPERWFRDRNNEENIFM